MIKTQTKSQTNKHTGWKHYHLANAGDNYYLRTNDDLLSVESVGTNNEIPIMKMQIFSSIQLILHIWKVFCKISSISVECWCTVYPKKYAHGFCFAVLCCGYTLTDFSIPIRLTSLALWQSNDCPSASKATLMNMDKYFMWIHYERLHNHNKAKHNKTVCIFLGIYCIFHGRKQSTQVKIYRNGVEKTHKCFRRSCHSVISILAHNESAHGKIVPLTPVIYALLDQNDDWISGLLYWK